jgi:hypothetical protein
MKRIIAVIEIVKAIVMDKIMVMEGKKDIGHLEVR